LIVALEDSSGDATYVLDRASGEVMMISDIAMTQEEKQEIYAQIDAEPERYVFIEPISSSVAWQIMSDFVEQLPPSEAQKDLSRALGRSRPFRRFKDELYEYPEVREAWFRYHGDRMVEIAEEWLQEEGIEQALRPLPGRTSKPE
jgi:hypothetical protein